MELADYLRVLRRRWMLCAMCVLLGLVSAVAYDYTSQPRYRSSARYLVSGAANGGAELEGAARELAASRAAAYAQLVLTGPGLTMAVATAGVSGQNPAATVEATPSQPFLTVTAEADTAVGAKALADAYLTAIPRIVATLEHLPASAAPVITVVEPADLPSAPSTPQPLRDVPLGLLVGLIIGVGCVVLGDALDGRLRETGEIERLVDVSVLGAVPHRHGRRRLVALHLPRSPRAEAYRRVRANLEFSGPNGMPRSIVVTSPSPREGKSSLAANLAVVAAQAGRRVVVVDADLRKPSLSGSFGVRIGFGLAEVLSGLCHLDDVLVPIEGTQVTLVPSGATPSYPSELVGSQAMVALLEELERRFDLVIVDTPPVLPVADASTIAVHVDGVVVVGRMGQTSRASLRRGVEALRQVGATVLGVVANAVVRHEEKAYGSTYAYGKTYGNRASRSAPALPEDLAPAHTRRRHAVVAVPDGARRGRRARPPVRALPPAMEAARTTGTPILSDHTAELPVVSATWGARVIDLDEVERQD